MTREEWPMQGGGWRGEGGREVEEKWRGATGRRARWTDERWMEDKQMRIR